jgi:protein-S-isoprenylcysteine O-methyltransferase Ste14
MSRARLSNLIAALPLVAWYGLGLTRAIPLFIQNYRMLSAHHDALIALAALTQAAGIAFSVFLIVLLITREVPRASARGGAPYAAAFIGTFAIASFYFLPAAQLSLPLLLFATLCTMIGLGLCLYALIYLGRSFAIVPSARTLVVDGPYRFVRHPLYLFEEIVVVGIMLQFAEPWALVVMAVHLVAQFTRMHYEEKILTETFPAYADYATHTKRLIPGVY